MNLGTRGKATGSAGNVAGIVASMMKASGHKSAPSINLEQLMAQAVAQSKIKEAKADAEADAGLLGVKAERSTVGSTASKWEAELTEFVGSLFNPKGAK